MTTWELTSTQSKPAGLPLRSVSSWRYYLLLALPAPAQTQRMPLPSHLSLPGMPLPSHLSLLGMPLPSHLPLPGMPLPNHLPLPGSLLISTLLVVFCGAFCRNQDHHVERRKKGMVGGQKLLLTAQSRSQKWAGYWGSGMRAVCEGKACSSRILGLSGVSNCSQHRSDVLVVSTSFLLAGTPQPLP